MSLSPDDPTFDQALADSGMDSGSDAGEFGTHLRPEDLQPDEELLLATLERDASPRADDAPDEELTARAAQEERPLPTQGGPPDDGLTPLFSDPG
jgi:hypothetical protein